MSYPQMLRQSTSSYSLASRNTHTPFTHRHYSSSSAACSSPTRPRRNSYASKDYIQPPRKNRLSAISHEPPLPREVAFETDAPAELPSSVGRSGFNRPFPYDIYYGHRELLAIIVEFLKGSYGVKSTAPEQEYPEHPSLPHFTLQIILITNLPYSVLSATIILLQRLRNVMSESTEIRPYRLFLAAFILAAREYKRNEKSSIMHGDGYWSNISRLPVIDIKTITSQLKKKLGGHVSVYDQREMFLWKLRGQSVVEVLRSDAGGLRAVSYHSSLHSRSSGSSSSNHSSPRGKRSFVSRVAGIIMPKKGVGAW
ncbi:hypothetical protein BDQ17DRAFT_1361708 [Cyathus striatus]|nr:hypothetical protein BDQ17DRAFT_1361708 [Cyathus striatus]